MQITGWPRHEVVYLLNRHKFDINEAIDAFYSS